jgi:beta-phosphoglucomutase family hydrolase
MRKDRMNRDDLLGEPTGGHAALGLPSPIRACLFDMDGVLTQTAKLHCAAWKQMFDEYLRRRSLATGKPFAPFDAASDFEKHVDGRLRAAGARSFLTSRRIQLPDGEETDSPDAETVNGLAQRKDEIFVHLLQQDGAETFVGSVRYVRAVRRAGLRTAVVSSSKHCRDVLVSAGLSDLFDGRIDGVVASENRLAGKPAPDTYLAAARALGVTAAEAAVFEDAVSGVEAGRAGHFGFVVGVDRVGHADQLRRHGADTVVTDLARLLERA